MGHESGILGILVTCPNHRILPTFTTVWMLGSAPSSNTPVKDGPEDASLKHAQSVCILRSSKTSVRRGPSGESMCDVSYISCRLEVFWISQQSVKSMVCTIPLHNASPDFAGDVVMRSNDCPEIADLLYHLEIVAVNYYTASQTV